MSSLKQRQEMLASLKKQSQPFMQTLMHLRAVQTMGVIAADDAHHLIALVGRTTLSQWNIDGQMRQAQADIDELTPTAEPTPAPTNVAPEASDADDSAQGH